MTAHTHNLYRNGDFLHCRTMECDYSEHSPVQKPSAQETQVASLEKLDISFGRFNRVEVLHRDCVLCLSEAQAAAAMAGYTGSTGATHGTTEVWHPGDPVHMPYAHVARVTDTTADLKRRVRDHYEATRRSEDLSPETDRFDKGYLNGMRDLLAHLEGLN